MSVSHRASSFQPLYLVAATVLTAVEHQALPFVTATEGALCMCVFVPRFLFDLGNRNQHIISRQMQFIQCRAEGAERHRSTRPRDFKSSRAATVRTKRTAAVQQQFDSTCASNCGLCDSHGAFVFVCVCSAQQKVHACNHDHIPRYSLKSNTRRRIASCHTLYSTPPRSK